MGGGGREKASYFACSSRFPCLIIIIISTDDEMVVSSQWSSFCDDKKHTKLLAFFFFFLQSISPHFPHLIFRKAHDTLLQFVVVLHTDLKSIEFALKINFFKQSWAKSLQIQKLNLRLRYAKVCKCQRYANTALPTVTRLLDTPLNPEIIDRFFAD